MSLKASALALCLLDSVREDFLPRDLYQELTSFVPGLVELPVGRAWNVDRDFFQREQPEILLTGWGAPRLPETRSLMPSVRYVSHLGGTVRNLVPRTLLEEGLLVSNWGTCHAATVAECALMLILATLRKVTDSALTMHVTKGWKWPDQLGPQSLYGKRVGLHGFGAVARSLLPLLQPFGVNVHAYSDGVPSRVFKEAGVEEVSSLKDLFEQSDVLVEVEAASRGNFASVTETHLRSLPAGAVFVNVGRADLVEEAGFLRVATEGQLQIGLDVYHQEPLAPDSVLRGLPNVCLLGHQAGPTPDRRRDCGRFALDNLRAYREGRPLAGLVDLKTFDRST